MKICKKIGKSRKMFTFRSPRRHLSAIECFTTTFPLKRLEKINNLTKLTLEEPTIRLVTSGEVS